MSYIIATISIIAITCIASYFLIKRDEDKQSFTADCLVSVILFGICIVPTFILMGALDHFNVLQEYKVIPITLPILTLGFLAVLATWGKPKNGSTTENKKDDFTAEAIVLTAVLSENDSSDESSSSNSSNSSSSSNSDDFFFL